MSCVQGPTELACDLAVALAELVFATGPCPVVDDGYVLHRSQQAIGVAVRTGFLDHVRELTQERLGLDRELVQALRPPGLGVDDGALVDQRSSPCLYASSAERSRPVWRLP